MGLLGATPDRCNNDRRIASTGLWGRRVRGSHSRRRRLQTVESSGQQLPKECRPSSDQHAAPAESLASSQLHQPSHPQGSGLDWLLSPRAHDKRASHRVGVVVVVVVVVVVRTLCTACVSLHTRRRCMHLIWVAERLGASSRPDGGGQPWPCTCVHGPKKTPHELIIAMMS